MAVRTATHVAAALTLVLISVRSGYSQYQPASPTVSPYLNLFNSNNGFLPNYHTFVRPMVNQQQVNRQLEQTIRRQNESIRSLQGKFSVNSAAGGGPTGVHGRFRNYSHFYSSRSGGGSR